MSQSKLNNSNNNNYKIETIYDSEGYIIKSNGSHSPDFYHLGSYKGYREDENTWELTLVILHFYKIISTFHLDHPKKLTVNPPSIDSALSMAKLIIKSTSKLGISTTK